MVYELYPAVDENYDFPPEIRTRLAISIELRNTVIPMTELARNNLTGTELWNGRLIYNTNTNRVNSYKSGLPGWTVLMEDIDIAAIIASATPLGAVMVYASNVAPVGWHLCDGSPHLSASLTTVLATGGHSNPHLAPDLRDRFVMGTGGSSPRSGGLARVTLSAQESGLRAHTHPRGTTLSADSDHAHGVDPPSTSTGGQSSDHSHHVALGGGGHGHNSAYGNNWQGSPQSQNPSGDDYGPTGWHRDNIHGVFTDGSHGHAGQTQGSSSNHAHVVDIAPFTSGGQITTHGHLFDTPSVPDNVANTSHENLPPYYALTYIIKTV